MRIHERRQSQSTAPTNVAGGIDTKPVISKILVRPDVLEVQEKKT